MVSPLTDRCAVRLTWLKARPGCGRKVRCSHVAGPTRPAIRLHLKGDRMRLRARWAPAALLLIAPLIGTTTATADTGEALVPVQKSPRAVPGQYIVTLSAE